MASFTQVRIPTSSQYIQPLCTAPEPSDSDEAKSPSVLAEYARLLLRFDSPASHHLIRSNTFEDFLTALQNFQQAPDRPGVAPQVVVSTPGVNSAGFKPSAPSGLRSPRLGRIVRKMNDGICSSPLTAFFSSQVPKREISPEMRRRRRMKRAKRLGQPVDSVDCESGTSGNVEGAARARSRLTTEKSAPAPARPLASSTASSIVPIPALETIVPEYHVWTLFSALDSVVPGFAGPESDSSLDSYFATKPHPDHPDAQEKLADAVRLVTTWMWAAMAESWERNQGINNDGECWTGRSVLDALFTKAAEHSKPLSKSLRTVVSGLIPPSPFRSPTLTAFPPLPSKSDSLDLPVLDEQSTSWSRKLPAHNSQQVSKNDDDRVNMFPHVREMEQDFIPGKSLLEYSVQQLAAKIVDLILKMNRYDPSAEATSMSKSGQQTRFSILVPPPSSLDMALNRHCLLGNAFKQRNGSVDITSSSSTDRLRDMFRSMKITQQRIDKVKSKMGMKPTNSPAHSRATSTVSSACTAGTPPNEWDRLAAVQCHQRAASGFQMHHHHSASSSSTGLSVFSGFSVPSSRATTFASEHGIGPCACPSVGAGCVGNLISSERTEESIIRTLKAVRAVEASSAVPDDKDSLMMLYLLLACRSIKSDLSVLLAASAPSSSVPPPLTSHSVISTASSVGFNGSAMFVPQCPSAIGHSFLPTDILVNLSYLAFRISCLSATQRARRDWFLEANQRRWWKEQSTSRSPAKPIGFGTETASTGRNWDQPLLGTTRRKKALRLRITPVVASQDRNVIITRDDDEDDGGVTPEYDFPKISFENAKAHGNEAKPDGQVGSNLVPASGAGTKASREASKPNVVSSGQPNLALRMRLHQRVGAASTSTPNSPSLSSSPPSVSTTGMSVSLIDTAAERAGQAVLYALLSDPVGRAQVLVDMIKCMHTTTTTAATTGPVPVRSDYSIADSPMGEKYHRMDRSYRTGTGFGDHASSPPSVVETSPATAPSIVTFACTLDVKTRAVHNLTLASQPALAV